jgi:16S rRNA (cytosine967-C5)-methyltransferase
VTERPQPGRRPHGRGNPRPAQRAGERPARGGKRPYRRPQPDAPRRAAFDTLSAVAARDAYANLILPGLLRDRGITGRDAAFATELAYGTLRARGTLDAVLAACSSRPLAEVDGRVLDMLRLGAYQLLRTRVPEHAAVSATVEVARVALTDGPARFVNAVLRRVAEKDEEAWLAQVAPARDTDPLGHLAVRYAHPLWIVRAFSDSLGGDVAETEAALAADDRPPAVHLVARPGRLGRDALVEATGGQPGPYSPYAVHLDTGGDPGAIPAVADGRAGVQDEGSQLTAIALASAPLDGEDSRWLDLCAGPGGKAALLGALAAQRGAAVTAVEMTAHRAGLVERAVAGLPVTVLNADGREVGEHPLLPEGGFDRVLVDAPCTGLGALRRRPEARWRRQPSDMPALTKLQRELITAALRAVRPGGLVAYVTCSPHLAETKLTVADAVRRTGAEQLDVRPLLPGVPELGPGPAVQLWPHRHGTDAMFMALLRKA